MNNTVQAPHWPLAPKPGALPVSQALAEATGDSIAELLSRDPENYTKQDRARVVSALRAQRERWVQAEALAASKPKTAPRSVGIRTLVAPGELGDLGL